MTKFGRKLPYYSEAFKKKLVKKVIAGEESCVIVARQHDVSTSSLYRWLDCYGLEFSVNFESSIEIEPKQNRVDSKKNKKDKDWCSKRIEELEEQVRMEKLRRVAYEQMIKIAEERFEISIEKKYGTKQSKK